MFGYKPNVTQVATVNVDIFQSVPATGSSPNIKPDFDYALFFGSNTTISSTSNSIVDFIIEDPIDFSISSSTDPTTVSVLTLAGADPQSFLLKKTKKSNFINY